MYIESTYKKEEQPLSCKIINDSIYAEITIDNKDLKIIMKTNKYGIRLNIDALGINMSFLSSKNDSFQNHTISLIRCPLKDDPFNNNYYNYRHSFFTFDTKEEILKQEYKRYLSFSLTRKDNQLLFVTEESIRENGSLCEKPLKECPVDSLEMALENHELGRQVANDFINTLCSISPFEKNVLDYIKENIDFCNIIGLDMLLRGPKKVRQEKTSQLCKALKDIARDK